MVSSWQQTDSMRGQELPFHASGGLRPGGSGDTHLQRSENGLICERIALVLGGWLGRRQTQPTDSEKSPEWYVPVVRDDLEACQEPPPKDRPPAFIFHVPDMELPDTEPA
jgi:hypothetical protein